MSELLELEHLDRRRWVEEIDKINRRRNEEDAERIADLRQLEL